MKSIHSRLQSRLSLRRNFIHQVEEDVALLVNTRRLLRVAFDMEGEAIFRDQINYHRATIKALADDQRLDKQLKNIVVADERHWRNIYL